MHNNPLFFTLYGRNDTAILFEPVAFDVDWAVSKKAHGAFINLMSDLNELGPQKSSGYYGTANYANKPVKLGFEIFDQVIWGWEKKSANRSVNQTIIEVTVIGASCLKNIELVFYTTKRDEKIYAISYKTFQEHSERGGYSIFKASTTPKDI